jgi:hypothetical protein
MEERCGATVTSMEEPPKRRKDVPAAGRRATSTLYRQHEGATATISITTKHLAETGGWPYAHSPAHLPQRAVIIKLSAIVVEIVD